MLETKGNLGKENTKAVAQIKLFLPNQFFVPFDKISFQKSFRKGEVMYSLRTLNRSKICTLIQEISILMHTGDVTEKCVYLYFFIFCTSDDFNYVRKVLGSV